MAPISEDRSVAGIFPVCTIGLAIVLDVFCFAGTAISLYVYWYVPHPEFIQFFGEHPQSESIEAFLFTFPFMQFILAVAITVKAARWRRGLSKASARQARLRASRPDLRYPDLAVIVPISAIGMGFGGAVILEMSIYRALWIMSHGA